MRESSNNFQAVMHNYVKGARVCRLLMCCLPLAVHKVHPLIPMMVFAVGAAILVLIVTIAAISMLVSMTARMTVDNSVHSRPIHKISTEYLAL